MIRHSNSFFLSLLFHTILIALLFFSYKYFSSNFTKRKEPKESRVCVNLSCLDQKVPKHTEHTKIKKQKSVIKKQTPPKPVVKKIIPKPKPKVKHEIKKNSINKEETKEITIKKEPIVETKTQKKVLIPHKSLKKASKVIAPIVAPSITPPEQYIDEHLSTIIQLLKDNLYYPRRARKRGKEGDVIIRFKLSVDSTISSIEVLSSNSEILSRGAIKTIENLSSKFPKPKEELTLSVPISYKLK